MAQSCQVPAGSLPDGINTRRRRCRRWFYFLPPDVEADGRLSSIHFGARVRHR